MSKVKVAVVGAAGYAGSELVRLLLHHPQVDLRLIYSRSQAGMRLDSVHPDLIGESKLVFTDRWDEEGLEAVFLALPHGQSKQFIQDHELSDRMLIIDLSTDFRDQSHGFVYGLPELNAELIKKSKFIANPGCFATAIELALLPLATSGASPDIVHIHALTGSTGAGVSLTETTHFSYRKDNLSIYKLFDHQHLEEIYQSCKQANESFDSEILFVPYRGPFTRGIWVTLTAATELSEEKLTHLYRNYYEEKVFTHVSSQEISLKQVVNTNKCILHVQKKKGQLVVCAVIDNLLKGAAGQAVQNFNLAMGINESMGLQLKSVVW
ncbi:MAG: N-acetyl-gamma-glutamyl-phosphate reductase [Cyclobacteriaceae bacterium]|nr:N-acetyl-gamma-glutamyl-phosphate reductase [Cyclobacteriaceae bacterium]